MINNIFEMKLKCILCLNQNTSRFLLIFLNTLEYMETFKKLIKSEYLGLESRHQCFLKALQEILIYSQAEDQGVDNRDVRIINYI